MAVKTRVLILVVACVLMLIVGIDPPAADPVRALPGASAEPAGMTIPYAGRLSDDAGQPVADGAYDLSFALYGTATGGDPIWSETQRGVAVANGQFLTNLGSVAPIPATALGGRTGWLAVGVRGPGETRFTALSPRQLVSVTAPAATTADAACPHDHLGEWWSGDPGTGNNGLRVESTRTDSSGLTGVAHNGANAVGVFGWTTQGVGVQGSSDSSTGVKGTSNSGTAIYGLSTYGAGVYGHSDYQVGVFGEGSLFGVYSKGDAQVEGNLYVTGSKSGYVVDIAQNDDIVSLVAGDVVVISGAAPAVLGEIPVIKVRRAMAGETSAVVGVVDKHYAPTPKTATPDGRTERVFRDSTIPPGEYLSVITLGAYKAIKVDASYGPIAPGDLLVASPNPGYAMRADSPQPGTIIGKALSELRDGTGVVPVLVTLQ
jgi:hypothetical protein